MGEGIGESEIPSGMISLFLPMLAVLAAKVFISLS